MKKNVSIYVEVFSHNESASDDFQAIQLSSSISNKLAERQRGEIKSKKIPKIKMNSFGN
jgi:hypothetical protein